MKIVGKINANEANTIRESLIERDKKEHRDLEIFRAIGLAIGSCMIGMMLPLMGIGIVGLKWLNTAAYLSTAGLCAITMFAFLHLLFKRPFSFDENSFEHPKQYRYFLLTNDKNVIREDVYIDNARDGVFADLSIIILNDNREEEDYYVGTFPIELKQDLKESVLDLEKEKMYVPYNANDVQFAEDEEDEKES